MYYRTINMSYIGAVSSGWSGVKHEAWGTLETLGVGLDVLV
jgi:hypothetical protein